MIKKTAFLVEIGSYISSSGFFISKYELLNFLHFTTYNQDT